MLYSDILEVTTAATTATTATVVTVGPVKRHTLYVFVFGMFVGAALMSAIAASITPVGTRAWWVGATHVAISGAATTFLGIDKSGAWPTVGAETVMYSYAILLAVTVLIFSEALAAGVSVQSLFDARRLLLMWPAAWAVGGAVSASTTVAIDLYIYFTSV